MVITYSRLAKVTFPVFRLGSSNWHTQDGLLYLDGLLLDDKNMRGDTLGLRRLQTPFSNLYKLNKSLDSLVGILKQSNNTFIDNAGNPFLYEKTKNCKLIYKKIKKIERKNTAAVLWLDGIGHPMRVPRPPAPEMLWAGVLYLNDAPWMIYEFSETKCSDTRRKV